MNKNEENSTKSSTWAEEQFRKEADELVKRLETDDRFDDFEPPEELFQKLVVEARDEGLLEEENTKHLEDETKSTEENTKENQNTKVVKFFNHRISKKFHLKACHCRLLIFLKPLEFYPCYRKFHPNHRDSLHLNHSKVQKKIPSL